MQTPNVEQLAQVFTKIKVTEPSKRTYIKTYELIYVTRTT